MTPWTTEKEVCMTTLLNNISESYSRVLTYALRGSRLVGSNPVEIDGFQGVKDLNSGLSDETLSRGTLI